MYIVYLNRLYSQYIHDKRFIIRELEPDRNIPDDLYVRRVSEQKVNPETFEEYVKSSIDLYTKCTREYGTRGCLYGMRIFYNKRVTFHNLIIKLRMEMVNVLKRHEPNHRVENRPRPQMGLHYLQPENSALGKNV